MRILLVHNRYQQAGGEDKAFESNAELLAREGHEVFRHEDDNHRIPQMNPATLAGATLWNARAARRVSALAQKHHADVVHFHNTFPLISPAAYYGARSTGAAVVQTLHNFRLLCINGLLFRAGEPCHDCVNTKSPWQGVKNRCYRDSLAASAVAAGMLQLHRVLGTWHRAVDAYIAPSDFAANLLLDNGLPKDRVFVNPNFVPENFSSDDSNGEYLLFTGRLSTEKGITTLCDAWKRLRFPVPLKIAGGGPLESQVRSAAGEIPSVTFLGQLSSTEIAEHVRGAAAVVFPSLCYEVAPLAVLEALGAGRPVIASGHGAVASVIENLVTGFHFRPGDAADLAEKIETVWADRTRLKAMRQNCRELFVRSFTQSRHYARLMEIYREAIATRAA